MEDIIYYSALPDGTENLYGLTSSGKIYCSDMHAYVLHDDKIISIPLDKENRLKKFVNYYNIFAPHYK